MEIFLFPFITSLFTSTFIWQWRSIVYFCCWSFIGDQCCDCTRRIFQHALVWKPITHSCNFGFPYDLLWKGWQLKQHLKHGEFSSMMNVAAGRGWRLYGLCPLWIWTDKSEAKWKEACWKLSFSIRRLNFHNFFVCGFLKKLENRGKMLGRPELKNKLEVRSICISVWSLEIIYNCKSRSGYNDWSDFCTDWARWNNKFCQ